MRDLENDVFVSTAGFNLSMTAASAVASDYLDHKANGLRSGQHGSVYTTISI